MSSSGSETPAGVEKRIPTPPAGDTEYRFVGDHATEIWLDDGTLPWVGPGDYIALSPADAATERTKYFIDNGFLIPAS